MALESASSAPSSSMSSLEASLKISRALLLTERRAATMSWQDALRMSIGYGAPTFLNFIFALFSIRSINSWCFFEKKVTQTPFLPALAVRPDRCM